MRTVIDKIFVTCRMQVNPAVPLDLSALSPPANYKEKDKIDAWLAAETVKRQQAAASEPYTGTFAEVRIVIPHLKKTEKFSYRDPASGRQPVCQAIRSFLVGIYPDAAVWSADGRLERVKVKGPDGKDAEEEISHRAIVVGFAPRLFIKMLGLECALPSVPGSDAMPLSFWYDNSNHRDITEAMMPKTEFKSQHWPTLFKAHGLLDRFGEWQGPGSDPESDMLVLLELAARIKLR